MNKNDNFCNQNIITEGWYAILKSRNIKKGKLRAVQVSGLKFLVRRFKTGSVVVTDRYCPHMGTDLVLSRELDGEKIQCAFHGMTFSKKCDERSCNGDKWTHSLKFYICEERYGLIWIYLGEQPKYQLPDLTITHKWFFHSPSQLINAHHHIVVCNGLDGPHTEYVHTFKSEQYEVTTSDYSVNAKLNGKYKAWWMMLLNRTYTSNIKISYTAYGPSIAVADVLWNKTRLYILFTAYQNENNKCKTNTALWLNTYNLLDWLRAGTVVFTILKQDADILNSIKVNDNYTPRDTGVRAYRDMVNRMPVYWKET